MIYGITYTHIIYTLILIVLGFLVSYYKANAKFRSFIAALVNNAESLDKTGSEKKDWVVDQIYAILPQWLKPVLTKTILSMIVQGVFDSMKQYAVKLMDKATEAASDAVGKVTAPDDSAAQSAAQPESGAVAPDTTGAV